MSNLIRVEVPISYAANPKFVRINIDERDSFIDKITKTPEALRSPALRYITWCGLSPYALVLQQYIP